MISCNGRQPRLRRRRRKARTSRRSSKRRAFPQPKKSRRSRVTRNGHRRSTAGRNQMSKRAPSTTQLLVIAGFALSCFGILLFLWITFGGPTPFKAKPYEIKIPFNEATQLAQQSDVRISGVTSAKSRRSTCAQRQAGAGDDRHRRPVRAAARGHAGDPAHQDAARRDLRRTHARQPQRARARTTAARCPTANVAQSVQLDEIFRTFDPKTRAAFQDWMQEAAIAIEGQGQSLSDALRRARPDLHRIRPALPRPRHPAARRSSQLFRNGATALQALPRPRRPARRA